MNSGIYEIVNTINGKKYIGSSKQLNIRKTRHFSNLRNNRHANSHLQNSFNKYGEENFEFSVILYCDKNDLEGYEQSWLNNTNARINQDYYNESDNADRPPIVAGKESHFWKGGKVKIVCKNCSDDIFVFPSKKENVKFCNQDCYSYWLSNELNKENHPNWRGGKEKLLCKECGDKYKVCKSEADNSKFCSLKCSNQGQNHGRSKLNRDDVEQIKRLLKRGNLTQQKISDRFEVDRTTISDIKRNKSWSHIEVKDDLDQN